MMAKIVKGSDFKGVVDYIIDKKKDTQIVASEGLFMENLETIAMSFNAQSRMNDKVTKPVGHIALSFSKEDELRLTNRIMAGIALEYMERMGIKNTQFFIAQHFDKEHPHVRMLLVEMLGDEELRILDSHPFHIFKRDACHDTVRQP